MENELSSYFEVLGLSKNEVLVYLALIDIGATTTGKLIEKTKIPSSRIYLVLESLIEKGLVAYAYIKNRKHFKAESAKRLDELYQDKKRKLNQEERSVQELIDRLEDKRRLGESFGKGGQNVVVFEGLAGIKAAQDHVLQILKKGDTFIVVGAAKIANEKLNGYFTEFHHRRAKKGILYKVVYNNDAKEFGEQRKSYPLTEVRYLPLGMSTPSTFYIYKDYVTLAVFSKEPVALQIQNRDIAQSFYSYFEFMWKLSTG